MKLRHYTIITTLALLAASCAHEESEVAQISDVQVVIEASFTETKATTKSTATAFESGDLLGLYAVKSGGELNAASNLINNHQLKVAESGAIVGDQLPAYYPDKSSSLDLFSYYPYQSGNATADALGVLVGIRTHQTDFSHVQASDLCYGRKLDAAPSAAPHPLQFRHSFAQLRLNFSLYEGCPAISAVKLLAIKDSAKLNLQTGIVTLLTSSVADIDPFVNNLLSYTAILPAQSLSGACVEITLTDGTIYYYHATSPIALTASATNTLNLTLSDKGKLTLASTPAITAWGVEPSNAVLGDAVNNLITLYWLAPHASYAKSDKVTLTITDPLGVTSDVDLTPTLNPMSSTAYAVLDLPLALAGSYPLTISRVRIYNGATMLRDAPKETFVGRTITKAANHILGLNLWIEISPAGDWLNANYTKQEKTYTITTVGTTKWTASIDGDTGAYIDKTSGTTGQPLTITWSYNATAAARTAKVTIKTDPVGVETIINTTQNAGTNQTITINGFKWTTGNLVAVAGTTDKCRIGAPADGGLYFQFGSLLGWKGGATGDGTGVCTQTTNGKWFNNATSFNATNEIAVKPAVFTTIGNIAGTWPNQAGNNLYYFGYNTAPYATAFTKLRDFTGFTAGTLAPSGVGDACRYYLGGTWRLPTAEEYKTMCSNYGGGSSPGSANAAWQASPAGGNFNNNGTKYFIPASGYRYYSDGAIYSVGVSGNYWSESVYDGTSGYYLSFGSSNVYPHHAYFRRGGFPVRCVSN